MFFTTIHRIPDLRGNRRERKEAALDERIDLTVMVYGGEEALRKAPAARKIGKVASGMGSGKAGDIVRTDRPVLRDAANGHGTKIP